jgi:hypothetical protein
MCRLDIVCHVINFHVLVHVISQLIAHAIYE